jgi:hypothetical protein
MCMHMHVYSSRLRYRRGREFAHIRVGLAVHLHLLLTYGLARGTPHAVVGSSHPPVGSRLVPYLGVLRLPWRIKPADGSPCCSSSSSSVDNALFDLLAGGLILCAPAKSSARDSMPSHLLLW